MAMLGRRRRLGCQAPRRQLRSARDRRGRRILARLGRLWESYVYRVAEYRDLGDWVLTVSDVRARGRDGIAVAMRSYQDWGIRHGKITTMRACTSEAEALATIDTSGREE